VKVNIQYSIELDEIPGKVREFLLEVAQKSQSIEAGIRYAISLMDDNMSIDEQLKRIDEVRREMADVDHILLDCYEILHGYQKTLVSLREPPALPAQAPNSKIDSGFPAATAKGFDMNDAMEALRGTKTQKHNETNNQAEFIRKQFDEHMNFMKEAKQNDETRNEEIEEG